MYTQQQLVRIARRENNKKRAYLVVNPLQAKHMAVSPHEALKLFETLADQIEKKYKKESLLLIGFAETATAIGAALAVKLNTNYIQTTRESIEGVEYLYFTESHSHATEQKLVKDDMDAIINSPTNPIQRILFVEDEVTTGNTILNIIDLIKKQYSSSIHFSVASLLNGMNDEAQKKYNDQNIKLHYLVKTDHSSYTELADYYKGDGYYYPANVTIPKIQYQTITLTGYSNARRIVQGSSYQNACEQLWKQLQDNIHLDNTKRILVIGTEEFMYPALYIGSKLEKNYIVKCHSTTRSPIVTSSERDYPLHSRFELDSLYEERRKTFLYDIGHYDIVLILTDSKIIAKEGIHSLINALNDCGNQNVILVRWW